MKEEITIKLDASQIAILQEMSLSARGVVLSTLFSLCCGTEEIDGLVKGKNWCAKPFVGVGEDEDKFYPLMKVAAGIKAAQK